MVHDMHELREWVQGRMDAWAWTQADVVRASGLSKQLISKLLSDDRGRIERMPEPETIAGLADAFDVPTETVLVIAARAYGVPVDEPVLMATTDGISDLQLARELVRRIEHRKEKTSGRSSAPIGGRGTVRRLPKRGDEGRRAARHNDG